jgi:hypothetical protein
MNVREGKSPRYYVLTEPAAFVFAFTPQTALIVMAGAGRSTEERRLEDSDTGLTTRERQSGSRRRWICRIADRANVVPASSHRADRSMTLL